MSSHDTSPSLEEQVIVIHEDGWKLFDTQNPDDELIMQYVDGLPSDDPDAAALKASVSLDHPKVELVNSNSALDVKQALKEAREQATED